jgi:hypothetical protein
LGEKDAAGALQFFSRGALAENEPEDERAQSEDEGQAGGDIPSMRGEEGHRQKDSGLDTGLDSGLSAPRYRIPQVECGRRRAGSDSGEVSRCDILVTASCGDFCMQKAHFPEVLA